MVYYGVVSKGCQRCRQRKIRCDQRKPACAKCEKSGKPCPGYRDLNTVLFRDDSQRTIRKARQLEQQWETPWVEQYVSLITPVWESESPTTSASLPVARSLSLPLLHCGASFFFAKYSLNERPFSDIYNEWLTRSYLNAGDDHALRLVIEAVGTAAISNITHAPDVAATSRRHYGKALIAVKRALDDPVEAVSDATFMTIILLTMFEAVNLDTRDQYQYWEAHIKGATALLELRGPEQFTRQLSGILYVQIRSQILLACIRKNLSVPPTLLRIASSFRSSGIRESWLRHEIATPGSISEISFRLVDLRADFKNGRVDPLDIQERALKIEESLGAWRSRLPSSWKYEVVQADGGPESGYFGGKRFVYANIWTADAWNNWRTLRIVVNQIIIENALRLAHPDIALQTTALSHIRGFSTELCMSVIEFLDSPRSLSLLRPLYAVALEERNDREVRTFAAEQLKRIDETMGIKQAGMLAERVLKRLKEPPGSPSCGYDGHMIPLTILS